MSNLGFILHQMQENVWSRNSNMGSILVLEAQWNAEVLDYLCLIHAHEPISQT